LIVKYIWYNTMTMNQQTALAILKTGRNVYLTGAAGSGKTYALNSYITYLKERGVSVAITASTGIAATHLGGSTIHSWAGIGIRDFLSARDIDDITQKEHVVKRMQSVRVLVIDEVSMLPAGVLDMVDQVCRAVKRSDMPFGGMQVVLSGDFFQLPPITRGNEPVRFAYASDAWKGMNIRVCYLGEQFRQDDETLLRILHEIRDGKVSEESRDILIECKERTLDNGMTPTRLFTHNVDVDALNDKELCDLSGSEKSYEMKTTGRAPLVASLEKSVLAPRTLRLKKNAKVMFVKNNFEEGYVNGTLGVVEDIRGDVPVVRTFSGKKIWVHPAEWAIEEDGKMRARIEQLPIRLAWAITIHKSQGMSMDAAEIDLSRSFVEGQGYVALSRLRSLQGLILTGLNAMAFRVHADVARVDAILKKESKKWEEMFLGLSDREICAMQDNFIKISGGTLDSKDIAANKEKVLEEKKPKKEKQSTYEKTRILMEKGLSLSEIAGERGMAIGTIITHLEKLKEKKVPVNFEQFKPKDESFEKIAAAFAGVEDNKLGPVFGKLRGKYSYETIRLARLFL